MTTLSKPKTFNGKPVRSAGESVGPGEYYFYRGKVRGPDGKPAVKKAAKKIKPPEYPTYGPGPYEGIRAYYPMTLPRNPIEQQVGPGFYIKMGFAGFNSPTNNAFGYKSAAAALMAIRKYQAKGDAHRKSLGQ